MKKSLLTKIVALLLLSIMVLGIAACGSSKKTEDAKDTKEEKAEKTEKEKVEEEKVEDNKDSISEKEDDSSNGSGELKAFKLGMMDPGAWNATSGPLYAQMELAAETLNVELVYAGYDTNSAEGHIAAVQNLISSGVDAIILLNGPLIHGIIPQIAEICDEAEVYWSLSWTKLIEGNNDYNAAVNSDYFVSTTYENDVYSANWCTSILGEKGVKNIAEIGFEAGNATGDMRDQGIQEGLEEYDMILLGEERDITLTMSSDGGKTIMERFINSYPEMDGLIIAGMSQFVLSGVVSAMEANGVEDKISLSCIDFHEFQTDYLKSGILDGIIGGHVVGPFYSLILIANIMNGTPLTEDKVIVEDKFIELSSHEDALIWDEYGNTGNIYSSDEIEQMMVVNNPDYTIDDFMKMIEDYSLEDIVSRAEGN